VILTVGWILTTLLMVVLVGFLLIPVMVVVSALPFAHAGYAAYKVSQGADYRYPLAAELAERRWKAGFSERELANPEKRDSRVLGELRPNGR
jgi:uncharacterized membrane protein